MIKNLLKYLLRTIVFITTNCLDNAIIENFFGILKPEMFYTQKFKSIRTIKTRDH